jgi:hypothetical protein
MRWWRWAAVAAAILVGGLLYIWWRCQMPVAGELERLYIDGDRRALIVYHPSWIGDFQQQLTLRFAEGLAGEGWQVRRITAHAERLAALDFDSYDTIVIGTNTYFWRIDWPTRQTLAALPDLTGRNCAGLVSGFGATAEAEAQLTQLLREKGCADPRVHALWLWRPNDETRPDEDNRVVALERAHFLGSAVGKHWSRFILRD